MIYNKGERNVMFMKLFLVEDATIYMILLQKLLENDFQITLSKNIADAKKIIEDEDYQFDVMLIDLITPGTMDLIRQIKKNKRLSQVPIVALTASDNPKDLIQAFDYGIYDCIQKPIYEEVVLQRVKNAASNYLRLKELKKLRESLMNNQQIDDYGNKTAIFNNVYQTIHVWNDSPKKRGRSEEHTSELQSRE